MTEQISVAILENAPLLRALRDGGADTPGALADKAGILSNNLQRKLSVLEEGGAIVRDPAGPSHAATLTPSAEAALEILSTAMIAFDRIDPWPENPRTQFDDADEEDLARSIGDKGVLQPLLVRPKGERFEVVIGERRRRAAARAVAHGWQPAGFLVPAKVREISDDEALEIAGVENLQREDMHWMDEAKWYLRLSARLSGPAIERLVGGRRGKRSIQDFVKCARELTPEQIAATYRPATLEGGQPNPDCLTYVKARQEVGEKKEKPALELSPKLALALIEVIYKGLNPNIGDALPPQGFVVVTPFSKPPVGGPVATLVERKLIAFRFQARDLVAHATLTEDVLRWLTQLNFAADPHGALWRARAAVVGELQTNALRAGEYLTEGLSVPEPVREPEPYVAPGSSGDDPEDEEDEGDDPALPPTIHQAGEETGPDLSPSQRRVLREIAARSLHRHRLLGGFVHADKSALDDPDYKDVYELEFTLHRLDGDGVEIALTRVGEVYLKARGFAPEEAKSANSCTTHWLRTDTPEPEAGGPAAPVVSAPPAAPDFALPPMLAIVAIELAHKIAGAGVHNSAGQWAAEVRESYYKDARVGQLIQGHKAAGLLPQTRDRTMMALTPRALEWLVTEFDLRTAADGRLILDDELLDALQLRLQFRPVDGGPYATYWLNPVPQILTPAAAEPGLPPQGFADGASFSVGGEGSQAREGVSSPAPAAGFSDQMRQLGAELRSEINTLLAAALREACACLRAQKGRSKPDAKAIDEALAYAEAALERAGSPAEAA